MPACYGCSAHELSHSSGHVAPAVRATHYEGVVHSLEMAHNCLIGIDAGTFHQFPLIADIWERNVGFWLNLKYGPRRYVYD